MKLEIITTDNDAVMANMLLKAAYDSAIENPAFKDQYDVTGEDLKGAERFRKKLIKALMKPKP